MMKMVCLLSQRPFKHLVSLFMIWRGKGLLDAFRNRSDPFPRNLQLPWCPIKLRVIKFHNSREDGGKKGSSHFDEKLSF